MIRLKEPMNYKGVMLETGALINLSQEIEEKMIENETAEAYIPEEVNDDKLDSTQDLDNDNSEDPEIDIRKLTKAELLELAESLGVEDVSDKMKNDEIIARIEEHEKV